MRRICRLFISVSFIALLFSLVFASSAFSEQQEYVEYEFPVIEPKGSLTGGYRFVDHSGSEKAAEYEYLHNSLSLDGKLKLFSFPSKLHVDLGLKNQKDYFGELMYEYKDVLYFRGINRTLFHNLDSLELLDLDPTTSSPGVDVRDAGKNYGIRSGISNFLLRFHVPDFPAHLNIGGSFVEKVGNQQQRNLSGSGFFNDLVRTSRKRDIDWKTTNIFVGANSHLGPIEVEFSHEEKRLDVHGDKVLFDTYGEAEEDAVIVRNGGMFPHNLVPELKGSTNTINIHTSYTGGLVASATYSGTERENKDSSARADYTLAAGSVVWMPIPKLTFFFKYRHRKKDVEDAGNVAIPGACSASNLPMNDYICVIRPSISSKDNNFSGTVRYQPFKVLTLRSEYSHEETEREHAARWSLPDSTKKDAFSLSADLRVLKNLNFKAKYVHKDIEDPAYNTEPDHLNEANFSASWMPGTRVATLLSYSISTEKRDDLHFTESAGAHDRDVRKDRLVGSITTQVSDDISVTASYTYLNNRIRHDILYRTAPDSFSTDSLVTYKDGASHYSADLSYVPEDNLNINAGVSHIILRSIFYPSNFNLLEPVSIATFTRLKARETVYSAGCQYRFRTGFTTELKYKHTVLVEDAENPYDDIMDGKAHIILLTVSKSW